MTKKLIIGALVPLSFGAISVASADELNDLIEQLKEKGFEVEVKNNKTKVYSKDEFDKLNKAEQDKIVEDIKKLTEIVKNVEQKEETNKKIDEENKETLEKWTKANETIREQNKVEADAYTKEKDRLEKEYESKVKERDAKVSEIETKYKNDKDEYDKKLLEVNAENEKRKTEYETKKAEVEKNNAEVQKELDAQKQYEQNKKEYESVVRTKDISFKNLVDESIKTKEVTKEVDLTNIEDLNVVKSKLDELTNNLKTKTEEAVKNYNEQNGKVLDDAEINGKLDELKALLDSVNAGMNVTTIETTEGFEAKKAEKLTELANLKDKVTANADYLKKNKGFYDFVQSQFNEDISTIEGKKTLTTKNGRRVELEVIKEEVDMTKDNNTETFDSDEVRRALESVANNGSGKQIVDEATYNEKLKEYKQYAETVKNLSWFNKHNQKLDEIGNGNTIPTTSDVNYPTTRVMSDIIKSITPNYAFGSGTYVNQYNVNVIEKSQGVEYLTTPNLANNSQYSYSTLNPVDRMYSTSQQPVWNKFKTVDYFTMKVPKGGSFTVAYSKKSGQPILEKDKLKSFTSFTKKTINKGTYTVEELEDLDTIVYKYTNNDNINSNGYQVVHVMNDVIRPFVTGVSNGTHQPGGKFDTSRPSDDFNLRSDKMLMDSTIEISFKNKKGEDLKPVLKYYDVDKTWDSVVKNGFNEQNKGVYTYRSVNFGFNYTWIGVSGIKDDNGIDNGEYNYHSAFGNQYRKVTDLSDESYKDKEWAKFSRSGVIDGSTFKFNFREHDKEFVNEYLMGFAYTGFHFADPLLNGKAFVDEMLPFEYEKQNDLKVKVKKLTPKNVDVNIPKEKKALGELEIEKLNVKYREKYPNVAPSAPTGQLEPLPKLELLDKPNEPVKPELPPFVDKPVLPKEPTPTPELEQPKLKEKEVIKKDNVVLEREVYEFLNGASSNSLVLRKTDNYKASSSNSLVLRYLKK